MLNLFLKPFQSGTSIPTRTDPFTTPLDRWALFHNKVSYCRGHGLVFGILVQAGSYLQDSNLPVADMQLTPCLWDVQTCVLDLWRTCCFLLETSKPAPAAA